MRKSFVLLLGAAFVATLPSIASANHTKHHRHHHVVMQPMYPEDAGPRFVAAAIHQIFVPFEVTFGPRTN